LSYLLDDEKRHTYRPLLLVEQRKLELDQPVADVLPEFKNLRVAIDFEKGLESRPARKVMTMRHLLTNTSGLGNWTPSSDSGEELHRLYRERGITPGNYGAGPTRPGYGKQPATLDEIVARVAELPLAYEPGTVLHYSIGFDVMTLVIERVAGTDYGTFLRKRLFEPLKITPLVSRLSREKRTGSLPITTRRDVAWTQRVTKRQTTAFPKAGASRTKASAASGASVRHYWQEVQGLYPPRMISCGTRRCCLTRGFWRTLA